MLSKQTAASKPTAEEAGVAPASRQTAEPAATSARVGAQFQRISPTAQLARTTPSPKELEAPINISPRAASPVRSAQPQVMSSRGRGFMGSRLSNLTSKSRETSQEPQLRARLE